MSTIIEYTQPFHFWIALGFIVFILMKLISWAKKKKTAVLALGILIQMFTPDPYVERTVKVVQEDKKATKKQQDENGDKPNIG